MEKMHGELMNVRVGERSDTSVERWKNRKMRACLDELLVGKGG